MKRLTLFVFLLVFLALPSVAEAATHTWCVRWATTFQDSGVGEDYGTASTWYGRGVRVAVTPPGGGIQTYYARKSDGCFVFSHIATSGFNVKVYAETRIGQAQQDDIIVRGFSSMDALEFWMDLPLIDNLEYWEWVNFAPTCSGGSCSATLTTSPNTDPVAMMTAAATWTIYAVDNNTSPGLTGDREVFVVNEGCPSSVCDDDECSCQYESDGWNGDLLYIQPDQNGARRKFLIGHEAGHWLHRQWAGGPLISHNDIYDIDDVTVTACDSQLWNVPGGHAMRSQEYQGGAFIEGFAHFMAALAFNDYTEPNAWFKYYKDTTTPNYTFDTIDVEAAGAAPPGGAVNWLHLAAGCDCDDSFHGCDEYGVEMDWLRFYWDYRENAGVAPTHRQIFEHVVATYGGYADEFGKTDTQDRLEDHVQGTLATRWDSLADFHGTDPSSD